MSALQRLLFGGTPWGVGYWEGSPSRHPSRVRAEEYGHGNKFARFVCRALGHRYRFVTPTHNCHCARCQACHCRPLS